MICTLTPLIKDNFGDITSSDNYRAIAGGCLLLKLLDIVILLIEGDKLSFSDLQFAYQSNVSTTVCTWAATSVINHFNMRGTVVYGAAMDMSKAFDMVDWCKLFRTLVDRKVDGLFLRLLLYVYCNQSCIAKWNGASSDSFSVSNGVRQGAVSSAVLFSVYIDDLILLLKKSRLGCEIDGIYFGIFIYADDILLLSASRMGLQSMVNICEAFTADRNLKFGTNPNPQKSKTKCIAFSKRPRDCLNLKPIILNGLPLPWVSKVSHLGCTLESNNSMKADVMLKRGKFVGKIHSLMQEFHFASESLQMKLLNTYTTSFYGSPLWDPLSGECDRIYRCWNVAVRKLFGVDRKTHRFLIEPLSESIHPKVILLSRMVGFYKAQIESPKFCVRFLVRLSEGDKRTVLGKTLDHLRTACGLAHDETMKLTPSLIKRSLKYMELPEDEKWRVPLLKELIESKDDRQMTIPGFTTSEVDEMLDYVCID